MIRAFARHAARAVNVVLPLVPSGGVVGQHRVEVARRDADKELRGAHFLDGLDLRPVRLRDDAHAQALCFQHAPNHRRAEGGMIHVGVARDEQHVEFVPPARVHLGPRHGQEGGGIRRGLFACSSHILKLKDESGAALKQTPSVCLRPSVKLFQRVGVVAADGAGR